MCKLDNYIFLTICEISFDMYIPTNNKTYQDYCIEMCKSLNFGVLSRTQRNNCTAIFERLEKVYSMPTELTARYLYDFFHLPSEKHIELHNFVSLTNRLFPNINK